MPEDMVRGLLEQVATNIDKKGPDPVLDEGRVDLKGNFISHSCAAVASSNCFLKFDVPVLVLFLICLQIMRNQNYQYSEFTMTWFINIVSLSRPECCIWYGDLLDGSPVIQLQKPGEAEPKPTFVNRILAFFFATDRKFAALQRMSKVAFPMDCGKKNCVCFRHITDPS